MAKNFNLNLIFKFSSYIRNIKFKFHLITETRHQRDEQSTRALILFLILVSKVPLSGTENNFSAT